MTQYASNTTVPVEKSRAEIERMLSRYGADQFFSGWTDSSSTIAFRAKGRMVKFVLWLPAKDEQRFTMTPGSRYRSPSKRSPEAVLREWDQEVRRRWRAMALVIKAKLEAVESGISSFEAEFLANIQLPDGSLFGEWASPALARVYDTGHALPAFDGDENDR